jgi:hypothetical protein
VLSAKPFSQHAQVPKPGSVRNFEHFHAEVLHVSNTFSAEHGGRVRSIEHYHAKVFVVSNTMPASAQDMF